MSVPFSPSDAESINATTTTLPSVPNALDIRIGGAEGKPDDTTMNIEEAVVAVPEIIMDSPQQEVQVQQQALEDFHSIEDHPSVIEEEKEEEHTVTTDSVGDDNIASAPTRTTDINQITTSTVPLFALDLQVRDSDPYVYLFITIHPYLFIFLLNTFSSSFWLLSILVSSERTTTPQTTPPTT